MPYFSESVRPAEKDNKQITAKSKFPLGFLLD